LFFVQKIAGKLLKQEHHKKETFEEELKRLFKEFGIEYDKKYFP